MRLRELSTGVVVSVDDARGAAMVGRHWEPVDKPAQPDHNDDEAGDKPAPRRTRKPRN